MIDAMLIPFALMYAATEANMESLTHSVFPGEIFWVTSSWNDLKNNLLISGVESYEACYRRCLVTNSDYCFVFRYDVIVYLSFGSCVPSSAV